MVLAVVNPMASSVPFRVRVPRKGGHRQQSEREPQGEREDELLHQLSTGVLLPCRHASELTDDPDGQRRVDPDEILETIGGNHHQRHPILGDGRDGVGAVAKERDLAKQIAFAESVEKPVLSIDDAPGFDGSLVDQVGFAPRRIALPEDHRAWIEGPHLRIIGPATVVIPSIGMIRRLVELRHVKTPGGGDGGRQPYQAIPAVGQTCTPRDSVSSLVNFPPVSPQGRRHRAECAESHGT